MNLAMGIVHSPDTTYVNTAAGFLDTDGHSPYDAALEQEMEGRNWTDKNALAAAKKRAADRIAQISRELEGTHPSARQVTTAVKHNIQVNTPPRHGVLNNSLGKITGFLGRLFG
jgi:hypothetical protein